MKRRVFRLLIQDTDGWSSGDLVGVGKRELVHVYMVTESRVRKSDFPYKLAKQVEQVIRSFRSFEILNRVIRLGLH